MAVRRREFRSPLRTWWQFTGGSRSPLTTWWQFTGGCLGPPFKDLVAVHRREFYNMNSRIEHGSFVLFKIVYELA